MPGEVPPPKAGLVADGDVTPRKDSRLVPAVMEVRDCSKPRAQEIIENKGRTHAERVVRARWSG